MPAKPAEARCDAGLAIALPSRETYHAGVDLTSQGKKPQSVYYVMEGVVKLARVCPDGREIILDLAFTGDLVGVDSALLGEECLETATTVTPCELAHWRVPEFLAKFKNDPAVLVEVTYLLCRQMGRHRCRIVELGCETARRRLEALLRRWPGVATGFDLPLNREEIGQVLLVSPYQVSRLLGELEKDCVIRRKTRRIRVQPVALWGAAQHA